MDAIRLLTEDHRRIDALFAKFETLKEETAKSTIVQQLYEEFNVHAQIEETIFYPAFGKATKDQDKVNEALEEHREVKQLFNDLVQGKQTDQSLTNKVSKLKELIQHHVGEEESEMFPEAREHMAAGELDRIGEQLSKAKLDTKEKLPKVHVTMAPEAPSEARSKTS